MLRLFIDFETRSPVDIKKQGVHIYAEHPETEIMCLGIAINDTEPFLWIPEKFLSRMNVSKLNLSPYPESDLIEMIKKADEIIAHNAMFEYLIWNFQMSFYDWPMLPLEKLRCTLAQCAYHALPLSLDAATQALNLSHTKDQIGHKIMMKLSKPRKPRKAEMLKNSNWMNTTYWHETTKDLEKLFKYCLKDVEAERALFRALTPIPEKEQKIWILDQKINHRGINVDVDSVQTMINKLQEREEIKLAEFTSLTKGKVSSPRSYVALKDWINQETAFNITGISADIAERLLEKKLPEHVRKVINIKVELSKSSTAKLNAMIQRNHKGRARGLFQYHGASTGRWAGRGIQVHNLPRDSYDETEYEKVITLFKEDDLDLIEFLYGNPFLVASRCIRGSLIASPDNLFICIDFSSIEGRALAYLAGEKWVLKAYEDNLDLYKVNAQDIFNIEYDKVTKDQRQIGKVSELALGYSGGIGAYSSIAKGYGIDLEQLPEHILTDVSDEEWDKANHIALKFLRLNPKSMSNAAAIACDIIKQRWRNKRIQIVRFWNGLEEAAIRAIENPGQKFSYGYITFGVHNEFLKCLLPSGRVLHYYKPKIQMTENMWGERKTITYMGMKIVEGKTTTQWARVSTFGGKLAENITQAFCRDILAEAMLRLDGFTAKIVGHVHDEIIFDVNKVNLELALEEMEKNPLWAKDMPIKAEGWTGRRYKK